MTTATNERDEEIDQPQPSKRQRQRKIGIAILMVVFLIIGILYLLYWLIWGRFEISTEDAYVGGNMVQLMPQVPGTVIEIFTDDTLLVLQNQTIIKLDPADTQIALENSKAALADTVRQVRQLFENYSQAQAQLILQRADLVKARLDLTRRKGLVGNKAISREELQHSQTALETAQAQYDLTLHKLRAALALVENSHLYTHPSVEMRKADLKKSFLNAQRTTIVAPVRGYVAKRTAQVGQQVKMSTPMLAIIPLNEIWVDANYKESQLSRIRIGQPVELISDLYGGAVVYHGKVLGLSPGTGSAFELLPPQNATGNWIKIVQRLPVRVVLDPKELEAHPLRIGLSMRVTIYTYRLEGDILTKTTHPKPIYSTNVYANQLKGADNLIAKILQDNAPDMFIPRSNLALGKA